MYSHFGKNLTDEEIIRDAFYTSLDEKTDRYAITDKEKFRKLYCKYLDEIFNETKLFQNIASVLDFLKERKIKMAIISFTRGDRIVERLKSLGIGNYFDLVLGGNDVEHLKPHPEIAEKAMEKLGVKPQETLLIGDADVDVLTGKNAKTMTALFLPETNRLYGDIDLYRKTNPDFEFKDFSQLPGRIKRLL